MVLNLKNIASRELSIWFRKSGIMGRMCSILAFYKLSEHLGTQLQRRPSHLRMWKQRPNRWRASHAAAVEADGAATSTQEQRTKRFYVIIFIP